MFNVWGMNMTLVSAHTPTVSCILSTKHPRNLRPMVLPKEVVGNDAVRHTDHCVSQATNLPCVFLRAVFFAVTMMVELHHIVVGGSTSIPRKGDGRTP